MLVKRVKQFVEPIGRIGAAYEERNVLCAVLLHVQIELAISLGSFVVVLDDRRFGQQKDEYGLQEERNKQDEEGQHVASTKYDEAFVKKGSDLLYPQAQSFFRFEFLFEH